MKTLATKTAIGLAWLLGGTTPCGADPWNLPAFRFPNADAVEPAPADAIAAPGARWDESWEDAADRSYGPADICAAVRRRVRYQPDVNEEDEWRDIETTWQLGFGDCEDFARTVKAMCDRRGLPATIHTFIHTRSGQAHAVVVGEFYGLLWMSSNGSFEDVPTLEAVRRRVVRELGWYSGEVAQRTP